jgi:hypothetical protein
MHTLFRKVPAALDAFKLELKTYIVREGTKLVRQGDNCQLMDTQSIVSSTKH